MNIKAAAEILAPTVIQEMEALLALERAVRVHDHGTGVRPRRGVKHHPCSLCDELDNIERIRRRAA